MFGRNYPRRFQQKRYGQKQYKNPYFSHKRFLYYPYLWVSVGVAVCIVILVCFAFSLPTFKISSVSVTGLDRTSKEDFESHIIGYLSQRRSVLFKNTNRFLFSKSALKFYLDSFYNFEQFDVSLKKNTLSITLKERASQLVWKTLDELYLVDFNGVVIRQTSQSDPATLPLFVDRNNVQVKVGGLILSTDEIKKTFEFHEGLKRLQIGFTETQVDRLAGKWIGILTVNGYTILFDATGDIDAQLRRLEILKKDTLKNDQKLQYIDLRFGDHVYYK